MPRALLLALAVLGGPTLASSQEDPDLQALPLGAEARVELDGRLSEPFWSRAVPIDDFTQQNPVEGAEPSRRSVWPTTRTPSTSAP